MFFQSCRAHPHLHSFPTRRSSDLNIPDAIMSELGNLLQVPCAIRKPGGVARTRLAFALASLCLVLLTGCNSRPSETDRKSTRLNSSHSQISYAVFCLKKKTI